jgi:HEAT repeat protein
LFFLEDVATIVVWLLILVMTLNFVFLSFVFYRRFARARYFAEKDAALARYRHSIKDFAEGSLSPEETLAVLEHARSSAEREAVQQLLIAEANEANTERISRLLFTLGFVERWARTALGDRKGKDLVKRSLAGNTAAVSEAPRRGPLAFLQKLRITAIPRAIMVDHLGRLAPRYAQIFLAEALRDPSVIVRRIAIENMGRNRFPEAIPLLIRELRLAVEERNDVSLRTMKTALISYRMEDLELFIPFLTQPNRRGRFFVIDTMRQICETASRDILLTKNDFSPELYRVVLDSCVTDEFEDVRARCAYVIKHFRDQRAIEALRKLLNDDNEYVRLHAVRACASRFYIDLVSDVVAHLTDKKWRVREASVSTLNAMGPTGREHMYRFFVACTDNFAAEQITEELQRKGLVQDLVSAIAAGGDAALLANSVAQRMAKMGKTSLLLHAMTSMSSSQVNVQLMDTLAVNPTAEFVELLQFFADTQSGQVQSKARQILRRLSGSSSGVQRVSGVASSSSSGTSGSSGSRGPSNA